MTELIQRLHKHGWQELCPLETKWRFVKRDWICIIHWDYGVSFYRRAAAGRAVGGEAQ